MIVLYRQSPLTGSIESHQTAMDGFLHGGGAADDTELFQNAFHMGPSPEPGL